MSTALSNFYHSKCCRSNPRELGSTELHDIFCVEIRFFYHYVQPPLTQTPRGVKTCVWCEKVTVLSMQTLGDINNLAWP